MKFFVLIFCAPIYITATFENSKTEDQNRTAIKSRLFSVFRSNKDDPNNFKQHMSHVSHGLLPIDVESNLNQSAVQDGHNNTINQMGYPLVQSDFQLLDWFNPGSGLFGAFRPGGNISGNMSRPGHRPRPEPEQKPEQDVSFTEPTPEPPVMGTPNIFQRPGMQLGRPPYLFPQLGILPELIKPKPDWGKPNPQTGKPQSIYDDDYDDDEDEAIEGKDNLYRPNIYNNIINRWPKK